MMGKYFIEWKLNELFELFNIKIDQLKWWSSRYISVLL